MRTTAAVAVILALGLTASAFAGTLTITPTTTLSAQTANNTSASDTFQAQSNGNAGAGNVSKVSIRKLLYPGATMPIYAHMMVWWGDSGHINIGYRSADATQVRNQVDDMMSRGINGVIIDWYGPAATNKNLASIYFLQEAELRNGKFHVVIQPDKGALKTCAATSGCDMTRATIDLLTYAYNTFETSPAYGRYNGRPLVPMFGMESYTTIDWNRVAASVPGNPIFIWRNASGFTKPQSGGAFSWVGHDTSGGLTYLDGFYQTALTYPNQWAIGSGYPGFNDTLAGWSQNRTLPPQNCGQTWLNSLNEAGKYYSSANQLDAMQLVTWNDYEEGTEIETGIENCVTVSASTSGNMLNWSIRGSQSTIDHFTVYISKDGQALMPLGNYAAGRRSLDLSTFGIPAGLYYLYVQAIGQPSLTNKMSNAASFSPGTSSTGSGSTAPPPPTSTVGVTLTSPANNSTVYSPIRVAASATASPGRRITAMKVYKDGTAVYSTANSSLSISVSASSGTHRITVNAWDNAGTVYKTTVYVTVK